MKKEKIKEFLSKSKPILIKVVRYSIITVAIVASFLVGKFVESYKNKKSSAEEEVTNKVVKITKDEVNIAIDETNNLIIFDNQGEYVIYEDSIGHTIFKLYSRNIWAQHVAE